MAVKNYYDVTMILRVTFVVDTFYTRKKFTLNRLQQKFEESFALGVEEDNINIEKGLIYRTTFDLTSFKLITFFFKIKLEIILFANCCK